MNYWLFKSEPDVFGLEHLRRQPGKKDHWDGVRNYQARNMMRDEMRKGDLGFFYHSNCETPGIAGIVTVVREAYPDFTSWDPKSRYYDPKSTPENPRWFMVDVRYKRKLKRLIPLAELKEYPQLSDFALVRKGNRLSIMRVSEKDWEFILGLE